MSKNDKLAFRLSMIITRLFLGESLSPIHLAEEFNVCTKTVHRDFQRLLCHLDIEKSGYIYKLSVTERGARRTDNDIINFAKMTYIDRLFPSFDRKLINTLLSGNGHSPFVIYTSPLKEKMSTFGRFLVITEAIISHTFLSFISCGKTYSDFEPYRLIFFKRSWFLVGRLEGKVAVFNYDSILEARITERHFDIDDQFYAITEDEQFIHSLPYFQYLSHLQSTLLKHP